MTPYLIFYKNNSHFVNKNIFGCLTFFQRCKEKRQIASLRPRSAIGGDSYKKGDNEYDGKTAPHCRMPPYLDCGGNDAALADIARWVSQSGVIALQKGE